MITNLNISHLMNFYFNLSNRNLPKGSIDVNIINPFLSVHGHVWDKIEKTISSVLNIIIHIKLSKLNNEIKVLPSIFAGQIFDQQVECN